jgi:hypothetical protein
VELRIFVEPQEGTSYEQQLAMAKRPSRTGSGRYEFAGEHYTFAPGPCERIGRDIEDLRRFGAAGTPQEVVERLREHGREGASRSYPQVIDLDDLDHIALIAAEVMPQLDGR